VGIVIAAPLLWLAELVSAVTGAWAISGPMAAGALGATAIVGCVVAVLSRTRDHLSPTLARQAVVGGEVHRSTPRSAGLRLCDPDASGRVRPRAPGGVGRTA
jgi:hypothetical protein